MARHEAPQDALGRLIEALRVLPGVGPKSAQRMAFYLLQHDRNGAAVLAQSLGEAVETVGHCTRCNTFSETQICSTCSDESSEQGADDGFMFFSLDGGAFELIAFRGKDAAFWNFISPFCHNTCSFG